MAPAILSYFGIGSSTPAVEQGTAVRALPGSWYTSQEMYELERRAIFSKRWLLTTHKSRFTQSGDWVRYDAAGFQFVLCRDREGNINAFHNVCRHRAYPVVEGDKGTAKILACRYHGWSYGLNGKLAKAPGYQELDGFDKSKNGLFPIHNHIDDRGFIWVNFDSKDVPEFSWEDEFGGLDRQDKFEQFDFGDYEFDHAWELDGSYNWKVLADNYNQNYHTHSDSSAEADPSANTVNINASQISHESQPAGQDDSEPVIADYYFPNASLNVSPHFFFLQKFVPTGPKTSIMRYEVYRNKNASEADFQKVNGTYKRIMAEDKDLCEAAQNNINAGVFINGEMHPIMEKGPIVFQQLCRDAVTEHHRHEQMAKHEIWPARQKIPETANVSQEDIDFCSGLACSTTQQQAMAW